MSKHKRIIVNKVSRCFLLLLIHYLFHLDQIFPNVQWVQLYPISFNDAQICYAFNFKTYPPPSISKQPLIFAFDGGRLGASISRDIAIVADSENRRRLGL